MKITVTSTSQTLSAPLSCSMVFSVDSTTGGGGILQKHLKCRVYIETTAKRPLRLIHFLLKSGP
jgi:hypothetical protein